jgi:superfamily II DNA or RNA helicase
MLVFDYDSKKRLGVVTGDLNQFEMLREHFSIANPVASLLKRKNKYIPSRQYAITQSGRFKVGLLYEIEKYLIANNIIDVTITQSLKDVYEGKSLKIDNISYNLSLQPYDYQKETIIECLKASRGIAKLATGAGKTLIIASLLENLQHSFKDFKCLIIVPDIGLVEQTHNDFNSYNVTFTHSKWSFDNKLDLNNNVIIAGSQILASRFDDNDWIKYIDVLIVDECHKLGANTVTGKNIEKIFTPYRFGFTGTLPDAKLDYWAVVGRFGKIIYEKTSAELRESKHLADVNIKICNVEYITPPKRIKTSSSTENYRSELDYLITNQYRQSIISDVCLKFNKNILIMVNLIKQGELLQEYIQSHCPNKRVYFIQGSVEVEQRAKIKELMESNDDIVCIAMSAIFSTGVNVKNIHLIIFASGGKSLIRTVQSIGRGLRLHPTKHKLLIIDIADTLYYSNQHAIKRQEIYEQEKILYKHYLFIEKNIT